MHRTILENLRQRPGITPAELAERYGLSRYRLHRLLRQAARELTDHSIVQHEERGIWIVAIDPECCRGMEWLGAAAGGYRQCRQPGEFADGCCSKHSECESQEMTAFRREIAYRCAGATVTPSLLSELGFKVLEKLRDALRDVEPVTAAERALKERYRAALDAACAIIRWKEQRRRMARASWVPPELLGRHRESSVNPFEFALRKHFALLEVPPAATREEVLKAWRRLARRFHPDTQNGDEEMMKAINLAKEKIFRLRRWD
ncbi:MAG: DnaJ domain-containing protein [Desulfomonile sp.]|nr:DnaJ domain-containing protein [Desulfomonile sp.]